MALPLVLDIIVFIHERSIIVNMSPPRQEIIGSPIAFEKHLVVEFGKEYGWSLVGEYLESAVLCFCRNDDRVNVYYDTGTVSFCFDHPNKGKTTLYHKDTSWDKLVNLFNGVPLVDRTTFCRREMEEFGVPEPLLLERNWRASSDIGNDYKKEGIKMDSVAVLALGNTWFVTDHSGRYFWGSGMPMKLDQKLRGRQRWLPHIDIVEFGPDPTSFFVQFADGSTFYQGIPANLERALSSHDESEVKTLALGPDESFVCLWSDGYIAWEGLKGTMEIALFEDGREVQDVNMGPDGEWFVKYSDGDWSCHGHGRECDTVICMIEEHYEKKIVNIAFGVNESFHITYE
jgi:hypothetical protein